MTDSANALQKAIFDRLTADAALVAMIGTDGVFDRRMTGRPMPYLVMPEIETREFGPETEEHILTIEAWSDAEGRKQVQTIADRVKTLLNDAGLVLTGASLVNLRHRATRVRREPKAKAFRAEMEFRAVTE